MIDRAMILAAGFGTRMRHLTQDRPKPLIEIAGRTLIDRALDRVEAAGVKEAVINLHYFGTMIREHLSARSRPSIRFSDEQPVILETGGGVVQALPMLGDTFFVVNSDAVWTGPEPLAQLARAWDPAAMDALLLCCPKDRAHGYTRAGDFFLGDDGRLARRGEAAEAPLVYTGAQIIKASAFAGFEARPFSLNLVWNRLNDDGRGIHGLIHAGGWCDVGTPEGIAEAEAALAEAESGPRAARA